MPQRRRMLEVKSRSGRVGGKGPLLEAKETGSSWGVGRGRALRGESRGRALRGEIGKGDNIWNVKKNVFIKQLLSGLADLY